MTLHGDSLRSNERAKRMFPRARSVLASGVWVSAESPASRKRGTMRPPIGGRVRTCGTAVTNVQRTAVTGIAHGGRGAWRQDACSRGHAIRCCPPRARARGLRPRPPRGRVASGTGTARAPLARRRSPRAACGGDARLRRQSARHVVGAPHAIAARACRRQEGDDGARRALPAPAASAGRGRRSASGPGVAPGGRERLRAACPRQVRRAGPLAAASGHRTAQV